MNILRKSDEERLNELGPIESKTQPSTSEEALRALGNVTLSAGAELARQETAAQTKTTPPYDWENESDNVSYMADHRQNSAS